MAQEPGASLMDMITSDPAPSGNPTFPPLGAKAERPSKSVPPRKSNVQMTPELMASIKTSVPAKPSLGLPKQKKKVSVAILSFLLAFSIDVSTTFCVYTRSF